MAALQALDGDTIRVRRSGKPIEIDATRLVPGDVVVVESGDLVPADMRLVEANNLRVNESALTGESSTVQKKVDSGILTRGFRRGCSPHYTQSPRKLKDRPHLPMDVDRLN